METSMYDSSDMGPDSAVKRLKRNMTLDFNGAGSKAKKTTTLLQSPDLHMLKLASPELEKMIIQANGLITTTPTPTQFMFPKFVTEEQEAYARGFVDALAQLQTSSPNGQEPASGALPGGNSVASRAQAVEAAKAAISSVSSAASLGGPGGPSFPPNSTVTQSGDLPAAVATSLQQLTATTSLPNGIILSSASTASLPSASAAGVISSAAYLAHSSAVSSASQVPPASSHPSLPSHIHNGGSSASLVDIRLPKLEEEPQTVPCLSSSPPLSPINMESQERIKLERKRARNRVAARKCRTRKLERISRLEDRVNGLKGQNSDLLTTATSLREQVMKLKQQIVEHVSSGCQIMVAPNMSSL